MPVLFQTISEWSQKLFQTSITPYSAKSIVFARKIQLNWEVVPALSHVTTRSFITSTLPQPLRNTYATASPSQGRAARPSPPAALTSPVTPFHLPSAISQFLHTPTPAPSFYHPAARQKREENAAERREKDTVGDQHWAQTSHTSKKGTGLKTQG